MSCLLLVGVLVVSGASSATAASGTMQELVLRVTYDGAAIPNPVDDDRLNGVVATGDVVGFEWEFTASGLVDGELTQTLPEGWAWDANSLGALRTDGSTYQSRADISADKRTLSAFVTAGGSGTVLLALSGMQARPTNVVPSGSSYDPKLEAFDGSTALTAEGDTITVLSEPRLRLQQLKEVDNMRSVFDFGDGKGEVPARGIQFTSVLGKQSAIGVSDFTFKQPGTARVNLEITGSDRSLNFVAQITHKGGGAPTLVQKGDSLDFTFEGYPATVPNSGSMSVRYVVWVAETDLPMGSQVRVKSTIEDVQVEASNGDPVIPHIPSASAEGHVIRATGVGKPGFDMSIMRLNNQADDPSLTRDPSGSNKYANSTNSDVASGATIYPRLTLLAGADNETGLPSIMRDIVFYEFWEADRQRIIEGADLYLGKGSSSTPVPKSEYTIQYTADGSSLAPEENAWVDSLEAAGGVEKVTGIRVAYSGKPWNSDPNDQSRTGTFALAVPMKLIAEQATSAKSFGLYQFVDSEGVTQKGELNRYVGTVGTVLELAHTVSPTTVVGGGSLNYTVSPGVKNPNGRVGTFPVQGVRVEVQAPKGLVSVNTSSVDPIWDIKREGTPEAGLQLVFTYQGDATTTSTLPKIEYSAETSVFAPVGTVYASVAKIQAEGAKELRRQANSNYQRAQVVAAETVLVGSELIQPKEQAEFETRWYNFQRSSQGKSYVLKVLPFVGDGRGTAYSGPITVASAELTNARGAAAAEGYASLQYTTAPASKVNEAEANDDSLNWQDATGIDLSSVDGITAFRAIVNDFVPGEAGMGGLKVSLSGAEWKQGDRLVGTGNVWLGENQRMGFTNNVTVEVITSEILGSVWHDQNSDGVNDAAEPVIPDVALTLQNAAGESVGTTRTGADGTYRFGDLVSGSYRVLADEDTLPFPDTSVVVNTFDLSGTGANDSGELSLPRNGELTGINFGYRSMEAEIGLNKTGTLVGEAAPGSTVEWAFEIENKAEAPLYDVTLIDSLSGISDIEIIWPGAAGTLEAGQIATGLASSTLTSAQVDAGFIVNDATVTARNENSVELSDVSSARVELPEGASINLSMEGRTIGESVVGGEVEWSYTIKNTGNVTLTALDLVDLVSGGDDIVWPTKGSLSARVLGAGESLTATSVSPLTQANLDEGFIVNQATASGGSGSGKRVESSQESARVALDVESSIAIVTTTNGEEFSAAPGASLTVGDKVTWEYSVTNTGASTIRDVVVSDDREGDIPAPEGFSGDLAPGESVVFTHQGQAVLGLYENVGTVTGIASPDHAVTSSDSSWYTGIARPVPPIVNTGAELSLWLWIAAVVLPVIGLALLLPRTCR